MVFPKKKKYLGRRWQNIKQQKSIAFGFLFIILLGFGIGLTDLLTKYEPNTHGDLILERYNKPSLKHWFGTDKFGRDVFSRVLYGGRISLLIAGSVVLLSLTIGLLYGTIAGYFGGVLDAILMRFLDFWLAFPAIYFIMTLVALFQPSIWYLIPILSLTSWMETARLMRAEVLSLKTKDFILAAKGFGFSKFRIFLFHLIPNSLDPIIISAPLKIGEMILLESALSFLGIGVQPPMASWGSIINDGREVLMQAWWVSLFPGLFIAFTVMSFNLIGEGIRKSISIEK